MTIQTLEDMLRSSVLQFGDAWHKRLDLMEFSYNNSFHSSIGMSPFEVLYGKSCRTPLCWSEVGERVLKSLADRHATDRMYNVGDWVFLKLSPWKGVVRFGKKGKLSPRYIGPYMIIERVDLTYDEESVTILDWKDKVLRNKIVHLVKVSWRNYSVEEATCETEERMKEMYPCLFYDY
ncbi:unnamed protein product [Malus baccata var. baccata]